ncbi:lipocalin family protein [Brevundimonas sp. GCM10030266]|uniref:lipocalin family protein n=1 Tax=Brevundimonas sp. GCM10030266 TaxID=3273386 RepID=UPI00361EB75E
MIARLSVLTFVVGGALIATPALAQSVDMDRFDGRWFEVVRSPNDLQKDCRRAQIDFTPQSRADRYGIVVTCTRRADGVVETLRANARVTDPGTNRNFRFSLTGLLSFGGLAGQNYRVQAHADDYSWAILSLPNRSDWWIWHRSQSPSAAVRADLVRRAAALGLPTAQVVQTGQ